MTNADEDTLAGRPTEAAATVIQPPPRRRGGQRLAALAVALFLGLAIGGVTGAVLASSDPTQSAEYEALQKKLSGTETDLGLAKGSADAARSGAEQTAAAAQSAQAEAAASVAALSDREKAVAAREAAMSAAEKRVADNSITEGTWTVGTDIAPGTYRTSAAVIGDCYWKITKSGTNGSDIVENDIPTGGFPTVQLSAGQDFTNRGCGTFVKQ